MRRNLLIAIVALWCSAALAVTVDKPLADPTQEAAAQSLFHTLKCVVCEGQSLADSDATLAVQMRVLIRSMLGEGKSEEEVLTFFRARYGDRITLAPPLAGRSLPLWFAPLTMLAVGAFALWRMTQPREGKFHD
jgi:cytochrome c-type biogenesis protein CcmH